MDLLVIPPVSCHALPAALPIWALSRGRESDELAAGIALKSLDDFASPASVWAGCWRFRQALKCAAVAVRLMGRSEDEHALRDAVLLTAAGDDPGPAGRVFLAYKGFPRENPPFPRKRWQTSPIFSDLPGTIG